MHKLLLAIELEKFNGEKSKKLQEEYNKLKKEYAAMQVLERMSSKTL